MNVLVIDVGTSGEMSDRETGILSGNLSGKQLGRTESGRLGKCTIQHFETVRSRS